jgi:hypothetical protein
MPSQILAQFCSAAMADFYSGVDTLADGRIQLKADGKPSINGWKQYLSDTKGMPFCLFGLTCLT